MSDKDIQDAIGLCINNTNPQWDLKIRGSAVTEAALKLLKDESLAPPFQIMRTLLLACRIMPDVKKFMLMEAIPRLARRRAWDIAPRVWDGVLHAMKKYFAGSRDGVESMLRTILGLPMKQYKIVLEICGEKINTTLSAAVKTFSVQEKEEVLSGEWLGLSEDNEKGAGELKVSLLAVSD